MSSDKRKHETGLDEDLSRRLGKESKNVSPFICNRGLVAGKHRGQVRSYQASNGKGEMSRAVTSPVNYLQAEEDNGSNCGLQEQAAERMDIPDLNLPLPGSLMNKHHRGLLESTMEGVPDLQREDSVGEELPEGHAGGQTIAHMPFPNNTPASGSDFNSDNRVQSLLQALNTTQQNQLVQQQQLFKTLEQHNQELKKEKQELKLENQELKRKFGEWKALLWELHHVTDHVSSCPDARRPSERRLQV